MQGVRCKVLAAEVDVHCSEEGERPCRCGVGLRVEIACVRRGSDGESRRPTCTERERERESVCECE